MATRSLPTLGRHLTRALAGLAVLSLLLLLAFNALLLYLRTPAGTARLLRIGVDAANGAIAGQVSAGSASITGDRIVLHQVALVDPEGRLVASIEEAQVDLVWSALLYGHVEATEVRLRRPVFSAVLDEDGSNLDRAFDARHPGPPDTAGRPPPITFVVRHFDIEDGRVEIQSPEGPPLTISGLGLGGGGRYALRSQDFQLDVRGNGSLDRPTPGPVTVSVQGEHRGGHLAADVDVRASGASVVGDLRAEGAQSLDGHLAVDVPAALGRALVRHWPLRVPLALTAEASREGAGFRVTGQAAAGRARVELHADVDVERSTARRLRIEARHLDLAELFGRGPATDVALTVTGSGSGTSLATASGKLELTVPPTRVRDMPVGPVEVAVQVQKGRFDVSSLHATLPGVVIDGTGHASSRSLEGVLTLEVSDLGGLSRTLGDLAGPLPPLAGQGSLRVQVGGRLSHPSIDARGSFAALSVGPSSAQGVTLELMLPDVARPLDANARLHANALVVSGRSMPDVTARLSSEGRVVEFQLSAATPVNVRGAGTADRDARGLLLDTLVLEFPEVTWTLAAPAAVRFDKRLSTERLELVSGAQSIAFSGRAEGTRVEADLRVTKLDLARLPAVLAPPALGLAGILDAAAEAHGREAHPDVSVTADLAGGAWHGLSGLSFHLDGRRSGDRVTLSGHASGLGSSVDASLHGPETALTRRIHQPLDVKLTAEDVDLGVALCQLATARLLPSGCPGGIPLVTGRSAVELELDGYADGPGVHLTLRGAEVRARKLPPADWTLSIDGDDVTPVAIKLQGKALDGTLSLETTLEGTTGQLLARRRTLAGWKTVPFRGSFRAAGLSLAPLQQTGLIDLEMQGTVALRADLSGTLGAPRGQADLQIDKLVIDPWPVTDVHLEIHADSTVDARLSLSGAAGKSGTVHLQVGGPLVQLVTSQSAEDLSRVPVQLQGELGPVELRDLPLNAARLRRDRRLLDGQLKLQFEGQGTLLAPTATAVLTATHLGPSDGAHFEGTATLHYLDGKHALAARLVSASGGRLDLDGEVQLDLSLPALRRGFHPGEAPLQARLHSVAFEPDFAATLIPWMRSITGKLQIDGEAAGALGYPELKGSLAWTDGSMGVIGFGLYQMIQLKVSASNDRFAIEQLTARVQGGMLTLHLEGTRATDGFAVKGALTTEELPVVLDDQLWCIASLKADLSGTARRWTLDLDQVKLTQAELELPESKRRNLQDLNSPPDVVLTRHGKPVDLRQALRAAALDPRRSGRAGLGVEQQPEQLLLRLALEDPNHVYVRSKDVNLELALSREFKVDLGEQANVYGDIRIVRGRGDVWGRRFEVQSGGRVSFNGLASQPSINVTGVYTNAQNNVKVYMRFSGEGGDVQITPSSEPPMAESEIYTLLATGRTTLKQSSLGSSSDLGASNAGASILGSWAAGELKKAVGSALPIDVVSVEVQQERGYTQTKLEAGKYLTDDIYIGYQARINADPFRYQNANALRVEYQFLRRWSLQLEYGDANAGSLDAVWSRDY